MNDKRFASGVGSKEVIVSLKRPNWSKIFMFSVILLLVGGIGWVAGSVISRYDVTRYEDSVDVFIGKGVESQTVIAEYGDQKTQLNSYNFQALRDLLTITERKKILSAPDTTGLEFITVTVDSENYLTFYRLNDDEDTLIVTCFEGKKRNFLVDGPKYRVFSRTLTYISPEGLNGQNEVIE